MTEFLADLGAIAPPVGGGTFAFAADDGHCNGWVQFIIRSASQIEIHRLWTLKPGKGNGSMMLKAVCALADQHGIEIVLKALPFGRKPFKMSADDLATLVSPARLHRHPAKAGAKAWVAKSPVA